MLSGLFGDPLWCVYCLRICIKISHTTRYPTCKADTLTLSLSRSEAALNLFCLIQGFPVAVFVREIMKIICNNARNHSARHHCHMSKGLCCSVPFRSGLVSSVGSAWRFVRCRRMQHKSFISSQCALALFGTAQMDINSWQQFWRFSWMMMLTMMMYSLLPTGFIFN